MFGTEQSLVYTLPVPAHMRRTAAEIAEIDSVAAPTEEQQRRRMELAKETPTATDYRITVGTIMGLQQGRYRARVRQMHDWFAEAEGVTVEEVSTAVLESADGEQLDEETARRMGLLMLAGAWAVCVSALVKLERRERNLVDGGGEWKTVKAPKEWETPDGFLSSVPEALVHKWRALAEDVNYGLWSAPMDEDAKNFGGVSAITSKTH